MSGLGDYSVCTVSCPGEDGGGSDARGGSAFDAHAPADGSPTPVGDDGAPDAAGDSGQPGDALDASGDVAASFDAEASTESGGEDAAPGGDDGPSCGATDTLPNCGACGQSCDTTHSQPTACTGGVCTYGSCSSGWSNCNTAAPDVDGCECNTPSCCAGACQTAHDNGSGQTFYDCTAEGTYSQTQAMEACEAYTGKASECTAAPSGLCGTARAVCSNGAQQCWCWQYAGTNAGTVEHVTGPLCPNGCPSGSGTAWN